MCVHGINIKGEWQDKVEGGRALAHVANLNSRWSEAEIADPEKAAIRLLWKEAEDARRAHHEWLSQYAEGSEASWREKLVHLFSVIPISRICGSAFRLGTPSWVAKEKIESGL